MRRGVPRRVHADHGRDAFASLLARMTDPPVIVFVTAFEEHKM